MEPKAESTWDLIRLLKLVQFYPWNSNRVGRGRIVCSCRMIMTYGGNIETYDHFGDNTYSILYGHEGLRIRSYVQFTAHCVVIPANHGYRRLNLPSYEQPL